MQSSVRNFGLLGIFVLLNTISADRLNAAEIASTDSLSVDGIVSRMESFGDANRSNTHAYLLTRHYQIVKIGSTKPKDQAGITAEVSFNPPGTKEYRIIEAKGSDRAEGVVKKILEHEKKAASEQDAPTEIARSNYEFALQGREKLDGHECFVLQITPKRSESSLIKGQVWVDAEHFQIRQITGSLAKNPSFMVKGVQVTIKYAEADGIWMPVVSTAIADVRIAGRYEVKADAVKIENSQVLASRSNYMPQDRR